MDDKQPMVFEDLPIGEEFADEYVLTPDLARDYAEGIADANPWYLEHSPDVKFIRPIYAGDTLTIRGRITGKSETSTGVCIALDIWCETQRGEPVTVGTGSVVVH